MHLQDVLLLLMYLTTDRSSQQRCSIKKSVLKNFEKLTGKSLCQSLKALNTFFTGHLWKTASELRNLVLKKQLDSLNIFHFIGKLFSLYFVCCGFFCRCHYDNIKVIPKIHFVNWIILKLECSLWLYCGSLHTHLPLSILTFAWSR